MAHQPTPKSATPIIIAAIAVAGMLVSWVWAWSRADQAKLERRALEARIEGLERQVTREQELRELERQAKGQAGIDAARAEGYREAQERFLKVRREAALESSGGNVCSFCKGKGITNGALCLVCKK
jgi:outer membrane murein-binding lipoprotein Lpp